MSKQIVEIASEVAAQHEDRVAELERENAELRRENRLWEWRISQIIRFIDGKPQEECPE